MANLSFTEITIPEIKTPDQSQGFYNEPIKDVQIDVWTNRRISSMQFFALDVWSSSWATWDGTFRKIVFQWNNGDKQKTYTEVILDWLGTTTAKISKSYNIDTPINNVIRVPWWKVLECYARFSSSTQNLEINRTWWSIRYLKWSSDTLTSTNENVSWLNASEDNVDVVLKFATSASDRPIFGVFIKIY